MKEHFEIYIQTIKTHLNVLHQSEVKLNKTNIHGIYNKFNTFCLICCLWGIMNDVWSMLSINTNRPITI